MNQYQASIGCEDSGGGSLIDGLLNGVELTLLDSKAIALGFVRQSLVEELCNRATTQLVRQGVQR